VTTVRELLVAPLVRRGVLPDDADTTALQHIAYQELEARVGAAISQSVSPDELAEFGTFADAGDDQGAQDWLGRCVPEYPRITNESVAALLEEAVELARTRDLTTLSRWPVRIPPALNGAAVALWVRGFRVEHAELVSLAEQVEQRARSIVTVDDESSLDEDARSELADLRAAIGAGQVPASLADTWFQRRFPDRERRRFRIVRDLLNQLLDAYHDSR